MDLTTPTDDREGLALAIYEEHPMAAGDAVLLLDGTMCLELGAMADVWVDEDVPLLVEMITERSQRAVVAIAREGRELLPRDRRLWRELHDALQDSGVELPPLQVLPAA